MKKNKRKHKKVTRKHKKTRKTVKKNKKRQTRKMKQKKSMKGGEIFSGVLNQARVRDVAFYVSIEDGSSIVNIREDIRSGLIDAGLIINDITEIFLRDDVSFEIFKKLIKSGSKARCIVTKDTKNRPRSFFDSIDKWAKDQGSSGLAYFTIEKDKDFFAKGPIGKFFSLDAIKEIMKKTGAKEGDSVFLSCGKKSDLEKITSLARTKIAEDLDLIDENIFAFCWIVDYPMFEEDEQDNKIKFSHNPFSMPQGDLSKLNYEKPLEILAYQYDIVCNGIELSSGAIRNHIPELMYKLFSIAGYDKKQVDEKFSGMINALSFGAPPHGGIAPGIDRIVMLLANEKNIREVTMFPMNQNAQDLMMNAPSEVKEEQLKELNLTLKLKK